MSLQKVGEKSSNLVTLMLTVAFKPIVPSFFDAEWPHSAN
jgi:hypothetical protein